jgi:hypothetical protein
MVYCIGSRTGVLVREAPPEKRGARFDQNQVGLHHVCFRARAREHVDEVHRFVADELRAKIVHPPEEGAWAPGYYSLLFEDPDGIRVEVNWSPAAATSTARRALKDRTGTFVKTSNCSDVTS